MADSDTDTGLTYSVWGGADGWYVYGCTFDAVIREMYGPFEVRASAELFAQANHSARTQTVRG